MRSGLGLGLELGLGLGLGLGSGRVSRLAPSGLTFQSFHPSLPMRERYSMMPHESKKPHLVKLVG